MKLNSILNAFMMLGAALFAMGCGQTMNIKQDVSLETQVAQKIMIDLRYYCEQSTLQKYCRTPLTTLPNDIARLIKDSNIGGVILFSENLQDSAQIIKLNYDLQQAAAQSSFGSPLLISVDQEGGRVFRTPRNETIAFTGNMSIGATYQNNGTYFATQSARIIGAELKALGFNVNHAPTIDVNANPLNPVINVRSFGENPQIVADLGQAQVSAFQQQGIISTIKHFPGHGDTSTDSHTGLPRVDHDIETIMKMDIAPFKQIIDNQAPGMIMTAHIQYPNLDNSTFVSKNGIKMIKPATMSRTIMTDILRNQLGFQGVVITDALDMAGIHHFFNEHDAVINTFKAGTDIALMPIKIRTPEDLIKLDELIKSVVSAIQSGELDRFEVLQSFNRIQTLKSKFNISKLNNDSLKKSLTHAEQSLNLPPHKAIEQKLAEQSLTLVSVNNQILPIKAKQKIHLIMPDKAKCMALSNALLNEESDINITCTSAQRFNKALTLQQIYAADIVIGAHIAPRQSAVEIGGMDDLANNTQKMTKISGPETIKSLLNAAKGQQKGVIFVSLRTPYEINDFIDIADMSIATYAYNTHKDAKTNDLKSPSLQALAKLLTGKIKAQGKLPVSI